MQRKYPKILKEIRGEGLMVGVEFHDFSHTMPLGLRQVLSVADERLKGSLCGFVGSLLLRDHGILVAFTEYNRNVIRLEPPLIVTEEQVRHFIDTLDRLLSWGVTAIATRFVKGFVSG